MGMPPCAKTDRVCRAGSCSCCEAGMGGMGMGGCATGGSLALVDGGVSVRLRPSSCILGPVVFIPADSRV